MMTHNYDLVYKNDRLTLHEYMKFQLNLLKWSGQTV